LRRPQALTALRASCYLERGEGLLTQNFTAAVPARRRGPIWTFVHDVIFREHPEWFTHAERAYLRPILPLCRRADGIFTSSNSEARRIVSQAPNLEGKVHPVGLGLPLDFVQAQLGSLPEGLSTGQFLLTVGRLNDRKNVAAYAAAVAKVSIIHRDFPLVVVGDVDGLFTMTDELKRLHALGTIRIISAASDSLVKTLYNHAAAFAFPSLDEGFGLPLLEAASVNCPVVASNIPPFQESRLVHEFFDPRDAKDMSSATLRVLNRRDITRITPDVDHSWTRVVERMRAQMRRSLK
jgi:glycosyltransferase involved in cell wall biosynthesis